MRLPSGSRTKIDPRPELLSLDRRTCFFKRSLRSFKILDLKRYVVIAPRSYVRRRQGFRCGHQMKLAVADVIPRAWKSKLRPRLFRETKHAPVTPLRDRDRSLELPHE